MSGSQSIKTHKKQSEQRVPHVAAPKIKLHAQRVQQQEAAAAALEEREEVLEEQTEKKGKLPKIKIPEIGLKEKLSFRKESTASEKKTQDDDMEEDIFRLSTPRASGIWGLLFSRTFLFIILIVIQVLLWVGIYLWLQDKIRAFAALQWIFTLVMLVYLFTNQMDYSAKLTWMFLFALVPIPAAIFLLFTQTNFGHRTVRTRVQEMIAETKEELIQPPGVLKALEKDGGATDDLVRWMNRSGCFPAYAGSQTTYYPIGEEMFKSMIYELQRAERFIFLEYFILEEGYMWGSILEILLEKAAAGVEVRVMYDGMCEISTLPAGYWQKLRERGINAKASRSDGWSTAVVTEGYRLLGIIRQADKMDDPNTFKLSLFNFFELANQQPPHLQLYLYMCYSDRIHDRLFDVSMAEIEDAALKASEAKATEETEPSPTE